MRSNPPDWIVSVYVPGVGGFGRSTAKARWPIESKPIAATIAAARSKGDECDRSLWAWFMEFAIEKRIAEGWPLWRSSLADASNLMCGCRLRWSAA